MTDIEELISEANKLNPNDRSEVTQVLEKIKKLQKYMLEQQGDLRTKYEEHKKQMINNIKYSEYLQTLKDIRISINKELVGIYNVIKLLENSVSKNEYLGKGVDSDVRQELKGDFYKHRSNLYKSINKMHDCISNAFQFLSSPQDQEQNTKKKKLPPTEYELSIKEVRKHINEELDDIDNMINKCFTKTYINSKKGILAQNFVSNVQAYTNNLREESKYDFFLREG